MNTHHIKLLVVAIMVFSMMGSVLAIKQNPGVRSIDQECQRYGFDFGIAKWEYEEEIFTYYLEDELAGYTTHVNGTASHAYWWSTPAADGVLSKEAQTYQVLPGGMSGEVIKAGQYDISHVTLCGYDEPHEEVPEFGVLAALGVLIVAGVFVARRRQ